MHRLNLTNPCALLLLLLLTFSSGLSAQEVAELKEAQFVEAQAKIEASRQAKLDRLQTKIDAKWKKHQSAATASGDLELLLLIKDLAEGKAAADRKIPKSIKKLISTIDKTKRKLNHKIDLKKSKLIKSQIAEAKRLMVEYTKKNEIKEALAFRDLQKSLKADRRTLTQKKKTTTVAKKKSKPQENSGSVAKKASPVSKGLVLHYSFDKKSSSKVMDNSRKKNHGAVNNAQWVKDDKRGGVCEFNGKDKCNLTAKMKDREESTWSIWLKTDGKWESDGWAPDNIAILMSRDKAVGIYLALSPGGTIWVRANGDSKAKPCATDARIYDSKWHHLAVTFSRKKGQKITLYLDGQKAASVKNTVDWIFETSTLMVGENSGAYWEEFAGQVDDVMVFDRILKDSEIKQLFKAQK